MKLSNFTHGRENNFNFIRMVAAFAVLITHSFALAIGSGSAEPFRNSLGMTLGSIAVDVFFITSGFLVTASLLTRKSVIEFVWARVLRIFPALLVMLLLTVFGLGVFFTSLPLPTYLADSVIYVYLLKGMTLIAGVAYTLPGVFEDNPYKNAINGSLWTMPYEIRMYAILAILWVVSKYIKIARLKVFEVLIVTSFVMMGIIFIIQHVYFSTQWHFTRLFLMFFSGAVYYVLKDHIRLSPAIFGVFLSALIFSAMVNKQFFLLVYILTIAYILFYLAYIPAGYIRKYNQVGDYSYGVYIYAFPVQQSVAAFIPGVSVLTMILISAFVTLLFAIISWHILEKRALGLKGLYVNQTKKYSHLAYHFVAKRLAG